MSVGICRSRSASAGELVDLGAPFRLEHRLAGVEKHFRLEHEAVTNHADVRTVAQDRAQPPEEIRAVARELLHALRQRDVEALAEIGELLLRGLVLLLADVERLLQRGELAAQRVDLLVAQLDLGARAGAVSFTSRACDVFARACASAAPPGGGGRLRGVLERKLASAREARPHAGDIVLERDLARRLQRRSSRSLATTALSRKRRVLAGDLRHTKNCTTTKMVSIKMTPSTSVDSASTKPGQ
jgi:hypothetical protein